MFQSTPAITGERARAVLVVDFDGLSFNPRPPLLASEPMGTFSQPSNTRRFNPRPPLLASEPSGCDLRIGRRMVSIHARHYWRASLSDTSTAQPGPAFQSTPAITGERAPCADSDRRSVGAFQSTPAITGERASATSAPAWPQPGFNPRPPLLASEPEVGSAPAAGSIPFRVEVDITSDGR